MNKQAAIATANADSFTARNRHFLIRQSVLRESLAGRTVNLIYTPTHQVMADGLTKGLQRTKHEAFVKLIGMDRKAPIYGGC